jgi:hypothetical protein
MNGSKSVFHTLSLWPLYSQSTLGFLALAANVFPAKENAKKQMIWRFQDRICL